jgi:predicted component of type VI protein secretion system
MCKAGTVIIDSTKLKANASAERSKTKQQYQQWVERIYTDIKKILNKAAQTDAEEDKQYGEKHG